MRCENLKWQHEAWASVGFACYLGQDFFKFRGKYWACWRTWQLSTRWSRSSQEWTTNFCLKQNHAMHLLLNASLDRWTLHCGAHLCCTCRKVKTITANRTSLCAFCNHQGSNLYKCGTLVTVHVNRSDLTGSNPVWPSFCAHVKEVYIWYMRECIHKNIETFLDVLISVLIHYIWINMLYNMSRNTAKQIFHAVAIATFHL